MHINEKWNRQDDDGERENRVVESAPLDIKEETNIKRETKSRVTPNTSKQNKLYNTLTGKPQDKNRPISER